MLRQNLRIVNHAIYFSNRIYFTFPVECKISIHVVFQELASLFIRGIFAGSLPELVFLVRKLLLPAASFRVLFFTFFFERIAV
jgi:hypothetical protein